MPRIIARILVLLSFVVSSGLKGQDLPTEGASFFDSMQNLSGISYDGRELPTTGHPFEELLLRLNKQSTLFASIIPFGRSLQKMAAYPNALQSPRVLVATSEVSKGLNTHFRGRLFIAYVEAAKKLEVISYNPAMGRYEFQIVDNFYPGGKAQARYMPRSLCLRCHQGGTPIFAGGEWLETTAFNPELLKLSIAAIGKKEYLGIPLTRDDVASRYDLIPRPENFEDMVRYGALLVGYQKAWQDICLASRDSMHCKRQLLAWMLATNLQDKISLEPDRELLKAFAAVLGQGTIGIASEKLPDHNPVVNGRLSYSMPPEIDPSLPREPLQIIMPSKGDPLPLQFYKFHIFVKNMGRSFFTGKDFETLRAYLGPLKAAADANSVCLPNADSLLQSLDSPRTLCVDKAKWSQLMTALQKLRWGRHEALSREKILQGLDARLGTNLGKDLCCQDTLSAAAKAGAEKKTVVNPAAFQDQRLKGFVQYCSECHLYQDLPPPFLAGDSEARVLENIRARAGLIEFRLLNRQMPPQFARHSLSDAARQALLLDLKKIAP